MKSRKKTKLAARKERQSVRAQTTRAIRARGPQPAQPAFTCRIDDERAVLVEESLDERERRG